jgi:hypothetical protein
MTMRIAGRASRQSGHGYAWGVIVPDALSEELSASRASSGTSG